MTPMDRTALQSLADVYHTSPIGRTTGMRIAFDDGGRAVCSWRHTHDYDHAMDQVHGGLIATMLDNAGWFTAAAAHGEWVVTAEFQMRILQGTTEEDLRAEGRVVRLGRRLTVVAMEVFTASDRHVATGSGAFCPTGRRLPSPGSAS